MSNSDDDVKHRQNLDAIHSLKESLQETDDNLKENLEKIERRLESFISGLGTRIDRHGDKIEDHEKRVYLMERVGGWLAGLTAVLVASVMTIVLKLFFFK